MKFGKGDGSFALWTLDFDPGPQRCPRDMHVRWIRRNAAFAASRAFIGLAQDCVNAVITLYGCTARARFPFIASRKADIGEVVAARPLQQVSPGRRHIAQLRGSAT